MKHLLRLCVVIAASLVLTIGVSFGQDNQYAARAKAQVEKLRKSLNLTDDQAAKIQQLDEESFKKMHEARQVKDPSQRTEAIRQVVADREKSMKDILTPEQWEKRQATLKESMEKAKAKAEEAK
jgi:periplasmic protein CpxP/Spy